MEHNKNNWHTTNRERRLAGANAAALPGYRSESERRLASAVVMGWVWGGGRTSHIATPWTGTGTRGAAHSTQHTTPLSQPMQHPQETGFTLTSVNAEAKISGKCHNRGAPASSLWSSCRGATCRPYMCCSCSSSSSGQGAACIRPSPSLPCPRGAKTP